MLRRPGVLVAALATALALGACGSAGEANPEKYPPSGVDELVVPTPSPDPDDFVADVDNPWLPLAPGTVWTYDVSGSETTGLEVRVEDRREVVAGVSCVVVHRTETDDDGKVVREGDTFYAQDTRGNVWLFGEDGSWLAGEGGAEAGLAMPATPRVGDGYLQERAPGTAEDRSSVLSVDEEATVPAGTFADVLLVEDATSVGIPEVVRRSYAEGTGLVEELTTLGGTEHAELVSVTTR
jgi:hypothetical protein